MTPKQCPCCGACPVVVQWTDTVNPNATWVECECGMMTDTQHHVSKDEARKMAIEIWDRRVL